MSGCDTVQGNHRKSTSSSMSIGAGRPPVPMRLAKKIVAGAFIEMSDLLPERLGISRRRDDHRSKHSTRSLSILQCFSSYVTVVSRHHPERIPDLMGYQSLIIDASMEYKGDCWAGYDRRFRQQAASHPSTVWSTGDSTLWSMAFTGRARVSRCSYCFSLSHRSAECELSPDQSHSHSPITRKFCFRWNESTYTFPNCKFEHVCYICAPDPANSNVAHRAINCPQRPPVPQGSIQPLFPGSNGPRPTSQR